MPTFNKILVTTDFSDQALPAVEKAADLARDLDSRVELLLVVEDHLPPILMFTLEQERQKILDDHAEKAREHLRSYAAQHLAGCNYEISTRVGTATAEILSHTEENQYDLIVMASRGYGPVRQLLLGSTVERVLHHAPCPVLVIPSQG